jgi:hypothetical protein
MKKIILLISLFFTTLFVDAQTTDDLYGIVRQNYYSNVYNPIDSSILYQQFDSATIRLGYLNPTTGLVSNIGTTSLSQAINLTGAALDPYSNTFNFLGGSDLSTFNLSTGQATGPFQLNNPNGACYFDNFRFNNSDSSIYGLVRRNTYNPSTNTYTGTVLLGKIDNTTGAITEISTSSVANGFALAGSAIDPYQMVYYFSTGSNLIGLDLYNGSIYSNPAISVVNGIGLDNFTYSCADTALYGLVRQNYFTTYYDPIIMDSTSVLDSTSIKLGKINPNTGVVTTISPYSIRQGGYSLNMGSAINPNTMTYYFGTGAEVIGVSLITGLVTSTVPVTFVDGMYFDLMRNFENCIVASAIRGNPNITSVNEIKDASNVSLFPNPSSEILNINCNSIMKNIVVTRVDGKVVADINTNETEFKIDVKDFVDGIYIVKIVDAKNSITIKKFVKE